ncbi:unnamed protein product [Calypogeia fissa]
MMEKFERDVRREADFTRPSKLVSVLLLVTIMLLLVHSVASSSRSLHNLPDKQLVMGEYATDSRAVMEPRPGTFRSLRLEAQEVHLRPDCEESECVCLSCPGPPPPLIKRSRGPGDQRIDLSNCVHGLAKSKPPWHLRFSKGN